MLCVVAFRRHALALLKAERTGVEICSENQLPNCSVLQEIVRVAGWELARIAQREERFE